MMVYDGAEEGVNSSVSTCSKHSYLRGAKQRVNICFNFVLLASSYYYILATESTSKCAMKVESIIHTYILQNLPEVRGEFFCF